MAGQPPEPSFPPAGQESGLTQGRPAWQSPPSYTPPAGSGGGAGGGQAYAAPAPAYNPQDQTQTSLGQGQDYQGYQGYQQGYQGYGAQPGQGAQTPPPQWSAAPGMRQAPSSRGKSHSDRGFIGSLFDFSFTSMVTPKIIKVLYILFTVWVVLAAIGILVFFNKTGGWSGTAAAFFIVDPLFILISLGVYRIILEAFMVIFQIHGELKKIRENTEKESAA